MQGRRVECGRLVVPGDMRIQLCDVALQMSEVVRPRRGRLLHTRWGGCCNRDHLLVVQRVCVCVICVCARVCVRVCP